MLGEVNGREQVTPFELAGSAVVTGIDIYSALEDEQDPFQTVVNIAVLMQSLDRDANPIMGYRSQPGRAALFQGVRLDVSQYWRVSERIGPASRCSASKHEAALQYGEPIVKPAAAAEHLCGSWNSAANTVGLTLLRNENVKIWREPSASDMTPAAMLSGTTTVLLMRSKAGGTTPNGNLIRYELGRS